jgi:hypothetical protein
MSLPLDDEQLRAQLGLTRALPLHCADCRAAADETQARISRFRRMEDVAAAFAMVGLLAMLRQTHGRVVSPEEYANVDHDSGSLTDGQLLARDGEIIVALKYLQTAMRRLFQ